MKRLLAAYLALTAACGTYVPEDAADADLRTTAPRALAGKGGRPTAPALPPWEQCDPAPLDDALAELAQRVEDGGPSRWVQVDLSTHPRNSQYLQVITSAHGSLACGLVSAQGPYRTAGLPNLRMMTWLREAAGSAYGPRQGIQPRALGKVLGAVLGVASVRTLEQASLADLYDALRAGDYVLVDLRAGRVGGVDVPTATAPDNYAHFARVLGIDVTAQVLYVENSLVGDAYWTVPFEAFWAVWKCPEVLALDAPPVALDDATRWAAVIDASAQPGPASSVSLRCGAVGWISTCSSQVELLSCGAEGAQRVRCDLGCERLPLGFDDRCRLPPAGAQPTP